MIRMAICLALVVSTNPAPSAADRRTLTEKDLFRFVWVADPQIAPDGSIIAFVRVTADEKKDQYDTSVWLAATDGREPPRQLTSGTRDTSPRWSPDGRYLAFVRSTERDGKPQPPQIHVLAMEGGEGRAITNLARGAANPAWSPDGRTIAFSSQTRPEELKPKATETEPTRESDVKVITGAVYRANGVAGWGYTDPSRPSHIWTVAVPSGSDEPQPPKRITSGEFSAGNHEWSPDGSRVYFTSTRRREAYYYPRDNDLFSVSREGGEPEVAASIDGLIGSYSVSPDRKRIAFVGSLHGNPERSYSQPDLFVVDVAGGTPRNLTEAYDFDVDGGLAGDQRAPRGQHPSAPVWSGDGKSVLITIGRHGDANLARAHVADGRVEPVTDGHHEVMSYTASAAGQKVGLVLASASVLGDVHVLEAGAGPPKKLTSFNDELFAELTLSEAEEFWYPSFDGRKIQGWILKPPSFDPAKKYPLVLQIHGGPHAAYGNTFTHEFHWMAAKGYVVLYTNPRGSSNYGQEFGNIIQFRYPGDDYKDLMAGVDALLKRGYIDENRMAVTGGSGGGLLTNWVVTQTNRFKAAVSQRDISDWSNFWYTADFTLFTRSWFRKAPFEDPAEFAQRSPVTYASKIQTPMLFVLGDEDWRTPPSAGGEPLFRALKYLKRPAVMVRFPGENHELSRSGKPWHRVERLQHIVGWFDKWLLGKDSGAYGTYQP